jgi:hypothetical protein
MQVCNDDRSLHGAQIKIDATEREAEWTKRMLSTFIENTFRMLWTQFNFQSGILPSKSQPKLQINLIKF